MSSLERNFNSSSTIVASPKRLPAFLIPRVAKIFLELCIIDRVKSAQKLSFDYSIRSIYFSNRHEVYRSYTQTDLRSPFQGIIENWKVSRWKGKRGRKSRDEWPGWSNVDQDWTSLKCNPTETKMVALNLFFFFFLFLCNKLYTILNKYLNPRARTLSPTFNTPRCGNILFLKYSTHYFFTHRPSTNFV